MIYAIYLFAACKYNDFMESKETFWSLPDPEFLPRAPTEGLVPLRIGQISKFRSQKALG